MTVSIQLDSRLFALEDKGISEIIHDLRQFDRDGLVQTLCRASCLAGIGDSKRSLWPAFLTQTQIGAILSDESTSDRLYAFPSPDTLDFVLFLSLLVANPDGGSDPLRDTSARKALGEVLLQVSRVRNETEFLPTTLDPDLDLDQLEGHIDLPNSFAHVTLRSYFMQSHTDFATSTARGFQLLTRFLPEAFDMKTERWAEIEEAFYARHRCNILDVWLAAFVIYMKFATYSEVDITVLQPAIASDVYFAKFNWDSEYINTILDVLAVGIDDERLLLQSLSSCPQRLLFDKRPLIYWQGQYLLHNMECMRRFLGSELIYVVLDSLNASLRKRFRDRLGDAFEKYVVWLLELAYVQGWREQYVPEVPAGDGRVDVVIWEDDYVIPIEVKCDLLNKSAMLAYTGDAYCAEVQTSKSATKGVAQLSRETDILKGISATCTVFPVLVVFDRGFAQFDVQRYLDVRMKGFSERDVAERLSLLTIDDIEVVAELVANGGRLREVLGRLIANDSKGIRPFRYLVSQFFELPDHDKGFVGETFETIKREVARRMRVVD